MVHINEELEAAKAAIKALSMATPKSAVLATLGKAKNAAILNLSSGGALNEARAYVGIALSNASKMTRYQLPAALYAPLRVVLFENEQEGEFLNMISHRPSLASMAMST
jgi:hypothetical protein